MPKTNKIWNYNPRNGLENDESGNGTRNTVSPIADLYCLRMVALNLRKASLISTSTVS